MTVTSAGPVPASTPSASTSAKVSSSPPSKRDLASWWSGFKKKTKKEEDKIEPPPGIFGIPLDSSIKYANVAIYLTNEQGQGYVYGYVPIIIAKCGVFLKEKGTDIHGIFRLPGSAKRIKELQVSFDTPPRYGKGLDWTGYTVHDAGSIFRRYINALPEPVIPLTSYEAFRDPIRDHQKEASRDPDAPADPKPADQFDHNAAIQAYQKLITELPPLNRQLLLYLLDLLAVFASKHEVNGMDSFNLSAIFQPGILSHPKHDLFPAEYKLSQNVLVYLILNQDHFLVGMSGTEADEKTVKDMEDGPAVQARVRKSRYAGLGRSASNASTLTNSKRKISAQSNQSLSASSKPITKSPSPEPVTPIKMPPTLGAGSLQRSNTVPSKRSPGLPSQTPRTPTAERAPEAVERATTPSPTLENIGAIDQPSDSPTGAKACDNRPIPSSMSIQPSDVPGHPKPYESVTSEPNGPPVTQMNTPRQRKSFLFRNSPAASDTERKDSKQPNKLKKKLRTDDARENASARSSTVSLTSGHASGSPIHTDSRSPPAIPLVIEDATVPNSSHTISSALTESSPSKSMGEAEHDVSRLVAKQENCIDEKSPTPSIRSATGLSGSDLEGNLLPGKSGTARQDATQKKKSRWRLSSVAKRDASSAAVEHDKPLASMEEHSVTNENEIAGTQPVKDDNALAQVTSIVSRTSSQFASANESVTLQKCISNSADNQALALRDGRSTGKEGEKKTNSGGLFGRLKAKVSHSKEERKDRSEQIISSSPKYEPEKSSEGTSKVATNTTSAESAATIVPVTVLSENGAEQGSSEANNTAEAQ